MEKIFTIDEGVALVNMLISRIGELRYRKELNPEEEYYQKELELCETLNSKIFELY